MKSIRLLLAVAFIGMATVGCGATVGYGAERDVIVATHREISAPVAPETDRPQARNDARDHRAHVERFATGEVRGRHVR